jgi:hypothetical protein
MSHPLVKNGSPLGLVRSSNFVVNRKDLFRKYRDHLKGTTEADKFVTNKMHHYVNNTNH